MINGLTDLLLTRSRDRKKILGRRQRIFLNTSARARVRSRESVLNAGTLFRMGTGDVNQN